MMLTGVAADRAVIDTSGRRPGAVQGWVLVATSWLAVAAAAVVAPVSPAMAAFFGGGHVEALVQVSIGLPALLVALLAGPFGLLADRFGRKRLLVGALLAYALAGTAPLWLPTLPLILVSRAGVGMAEAAVLATGTALIGDYFTDRQRGRWFAVQGASATLVAVVLIALSGALGTGGWRQPFAIYALPVILCLLVARFVWEPLRPAPGSPGLFRQGRVSGMAAICGVTLFAAIAFYVVLIQLPFLLADRGFGAPQQVALGGVASAVTAPVGALIFRLMAQRGTASRLAVSFAASALGMGIIAGSTGYWAALCGAAINGVGSGVALPTLIGWALAGRSPAVMGRAAGLWNASFFLGQFLSPLAFLMVAAVSGARAGGVGVFAGVVAIAAVSAASMALRGNPPRVAEAAS